MTTDVKGKAMTTDVKGKTLTTRAKRKTKAPGAKGKTKATDLKEFLSNLATDPGKLGGFLHAPEDTMSAANLSEADKAALRSGVSGMVAARLAGVPLEQAFQPPPHIGLTAHIGVPPQPPHIGPPPHIGLTAHIGVPPQPPHIGLTPQPQYIVLTPQPPHIGLPPQQYIVLTPQPASFPQFVEYSPAQFGVQ